jgi:uncharacterized protein YjiS (DUF1127 family)
MSETLSTIARPAVATATSAFFRLFSAGCDAIVRHFVRRSAIATLHDLDDRALRDIGLARSQIEAAVHGFITLRPYGDAMMSVPISPRADGHRRVPPAETAAWS